MVGGRHDDAEREIAQGTDFEPSGDPVADRQVAMQVAARVIGHQTREYQKALEREFDDPAGAKREADRVFGERMREVGQKYDEPRTRERDDPVRSHPAVDWSLLDDDGTPARAPAARERGLDHDGAELA
jgi:hypothetical protein